MANGVRLSLVSVLNSILIKKPDPPNREYQKGESYADQR